MVIVIILLILLFLFCIIKNNVSSNELNNVVEDNHYIPKKYAMTETEAKFLNILKPLIDQHELIIFPQVQMQKIFYTKKNDTAYFNKIKSKSIDFAIVNTKFEYQFFIELDDYTHNQEKRKERDAFVNKVFKDNNLKLFRIPVSNTYNLNELENFLKFKS